MTDQAPSVEKEPRPIYTCSRCGRRLAEHGSHQPGWFRCLDGTDTPWSDFTSEPQAEMDHMWMHRCTYDDLVMLPVGQPCAECGALVAPPSTDGPRPMTAEKDYTDLAVILRATRTARGLSFAEVAEQTGLSKSVLHQIETGTDARWSTARRVLTWAGYRVTPPGGEGR